MFLFLFKHKTAYEMRISDWSSDVCSSDLGDDIVEPVARRLAAAARDREVLDVVRKLVAHPCLHGVGAGGGTFNDAIAGAVDVVDVVAREAGEGRRRSEERRVGKECVSSCRFRWSP